MCSSDLKDVTLHVIAGRSHERFWDLSHPGVEVEGFVSDVREAYRRATVVIAPLVASAGTNIKILEAMAMGKAVVSTSTGINGLDLSSGNGIVVTNEAADMAAQIERLLKDGPSRAALEQQARRIVEESFGWDAIARRQTALYQELMTTPKDAGN